MDVQFDQPELPDENKRSKLFFANTYLTKGIKNVLKLVPLLCDRDSLRQKNAKPSVRFFRFPRELTPTATTPTGSSPMATAASSPSSYPRNTDQATPAWVMLEQAFLL
jgi:hypothetical protein